MDSTKDGGLLGAKDPAIKLFGRKIPLPECQMPAEPRYVDDRGDVKDAGSSERVDHESTDALKHPTSKNIKDDNPSSNKESGEDKMETNNPDQDKIFKKPDKILPCPRCNSLDTKFCYFNNYNVNQPRHFCKNCQRYWTAGGTMRNVPVGAGRRKNKQFASQYRQILMAPDGMPMAKIEPSDLAEHQILYPGGTYNSPAGNGTVLKFGPDAPLCDSMDTVLKLGEQKKSEHEQELSVAVSSLTASSNGVRPQKEASAFHGGFNDPKLQPSMPFYPVPPWGIPFGSVATVAAVQRPCPNGNSQNLVWGPAPMMSIPGIGPNKIPLQFVPTSYLCRPVWPSGTRNAYNGCLSPSSSTTTSCCSGGGSPTLGKHSRDSTFMEENQSVMLPKTPRTEDPDEASKHPAWVTLDGIRRDQGFQVSDGRSSGALVSRSNPSDLSRAHSFQETS